MLRKAGLLGVGVSLMSVMILSARLEAQDAIDVRAHQAVLNARIRAARSSAASAKVSREVAFGQEVERGMVNVRYPLTVFHAGRGQHERWFARGALMANLIYLSETSRQNAYLKSLATGSLLWLKENVTATGGNIEHVAGAEETARHLDAALENIRAGRGSRAAANIAAAARTLHTSAFYSWYYIAGFTLAQLQWDARLQRAGAVRGSRRTLQWLLDNAQKAGATDEVTASIEVHPGMYPSIRRLLSLAGQASVNHADIVQEATTIQSYAVT